MQMSTIPDTAAASNDAASIQRGPGNLDPALTVRYVCYHHGAVPRSTYAVITDNGSLHLVSRKTRRAFASLDTGDLMEALELADASGYNVAVQVAS